MAASHVPNTPFSNRPSASIASRIPSGPCNYTNLNIAGNPKCGCQRFTDKVQEYMGFHHGGQQGQCVCEHHSCFHAQVSADVSMGEGLSATPRQSPARPDDEMRVDREVGWRQADDDDYLANTHGIVQPGSSLGSLPAIPSQCLLPSENGSRASSSQAGYSRPFAGGGLDTLAHIPRPPESLAGSATRASLPLGRGRVMGDNGKVMQIYHDSNGHGYLQSITEAATPSMQSSQEPEANLAYAGKNSSLQGNSRKLGEQIPKAFSANMTMAFRPPTQDADFKSAVTLRDESYQDELMPRIRHMLNEVSDYPLVKQNHEQRLDNLENQSFGMGPVDDLRDAHYGLDTRVNELEGRMETVERQLVPASASSVALTSVNTPLLLLFCTVIV